MANALSGQSEMDLGAPPQVRLLHFSSMRSGRHFIDILNGRVYEARQVAAGRRLCWRASVRETDSLRCIELRCFGELGDAIDWLQDLAAQPAEGAS